MTDTLYYILCALLALGVLAGISMMSKAQSAANGNLLSAGCVAAAVILTMYRYEILALPFLWISVAIGLVCGIILANRVKMIEMPQVVALLNGFGGAASAIVAAVSVTGGGAESFFSSATAGLALAVGTVTFTGSMVAAGKLHGIVKQKPMVINGHKALLTASMLLMAATIIGIAARPAALGVIVILCGITSGLFGILFAIRVGGADMPITISLLNSLSGVAGAIAGMAIDDILLVSVGGIVGASGLLLTQIMCRAMNRSLVDILAGKTAAAAKAETEAEASVQPEKAPLPVEKADPAEVLKSAKKVMIIPGYGMALAQAQHLVRELTSLLESRGAEVNFAIHPVAGRMPGHMNILLAEADIDYEKLFELEDANSMLEDCDAAVIIGANDVVNPAANTAENTPIYGMPVVNVENAKHIIVLNYDLKPGYAGVENPLYKRENVILLTGDASETLEKLIGEIR